MAAESPEGPTSRGGPVGAAVRFAVQHARVLLPAYALLLALASFFPFRVGYDGPRKVTSGATFGPGNRVELAGPSIVRTEAAPAWLPRAIEAESLVVRMRARTARVDQRGPARLVTLSDGRLLRNFMVSQKGPDLLVRVRRANGDLNGAPPLKVDGVFAEPGWRDLEVRFAPEVVEVLVDGEPRFRDKQPSSPFELWDPSYRLAIGDETDGARGWDGELEDLEFTVGASRWAPLEDPAALDAPGTFWDVPERTRMLLRIDRSWIVVVAGAHFVAFAVLGALWTLARLRRAKRPAPIAIGLACALFGAALQVLKLLFRTRHPELVHALPDGLGALAGALLVTAAQLVPAPRGDR